MTMLRILIIVSTKHLFHVHVPLSEDLLKQFTKVVKFNLHYSEPT